MNIHIKLWVFKESGIGLQLYWFQFVLWTSVIHSQPTVFLGLCCQGVLCVLEVVKINTLGVFFQRECVSWRFQGHYFDGLCVVIWFDYLVDYPVVFWEMDVALGLRVNQYKLLVYLSLTLNSFNYVFKLFWYKEPIVSKKQPIVFLLLCCLIAYIIG